ncbi:ROK family glucokinase [Lacticaseibacillus pantheris]|uniref:ROK family glucokinase n=1 Tax=Lacticaseibacillus pantheris TaxID=171523 RepID=UPI00265914EF|nr:ROK family glucokinase [Lacticaseibacillus pantheris]WKF86072.1 ROK family glucokinase [Lacticaseibacillus pantheris]
MTDQKLIGVDLGGTTTKFAITTADGEIQQRWSIDTNVLDEGAHIVPDIIDSINEHISLYQMKPEDFEGIGMGSPGSVDVKAGTVTGAYNLNWKTMQNVKADIEAGTHLALTIDNDANVAALGERWRGAGENEPDVVFVTLGTGVGGGVIADGRLLHGVAGSAGEIGHVCVDPHGYLCTCGNHGCLETVASATGVVRVAREMAEEYSGNSSIKKTLDDGDEISSKIVFDAAKNGDPLAIKVVDRVSYFLGLALANVGNTMNPRYVVIGGGVSAAGEFLRSQVEKYFKQFAFTNVRETTEVRLATLGNGAGVLGAARLALN